jgi:hypothetical protein
MHLPLIFALAPAVFFGLVTLALASLAIRIARQPAPQGAPSRRGMESALVIATLLAGIICLVCLVIGFGYINAHDVFAEWGAEGGLD